MNGRFLAYISGILGQNSTISGGYQKEVLVHSMTKYHDPEMKGKTNMAFLDVKNIDHFAPI